MEGKFNTVRIDLNALAHNLGEVRRLVGPAVKIMAVVKADAYGHGLVPVGRHLERSGADALGVMDLDEAVRLREAGAEVPIYILAGIEPDQCGVMISNKITPFIYDAALLRDMDQAARKLGVRADVQLKIDTGMSRLGAQHHRVDDFFETAARCGSLRVTGLSTHFADADLCDSAFIDDQLVRLRDAIKKATQAGLSELTLNNAANSAAVITLPRAHFQMVRPGIMLYGDWPAPHMRPLADLKPVMSLTSRVIQVKTVRQGDTVSYGRTWTASGEARIATVPTGYTHGYDRRMSNTGWALIRGKRAPIRGRVCMNMTMFDVSDIPEAAPGDDVILLGSQGAETITGGTIADIIGTIGYEVFCHVGGVNFREYIS